MSRTPVLRPPQASPDRPKYQPLPDLPHEEFAALVADIAQQGIQIPVVQDERGNTLDGHQRERAARALGLKTYPVKVMGGLSEEAKWEFALAINVKRRHLTTAQKRDVLDRELRRVPDRSNQWIGDVLGVDTKTVQAARRRLEATLEIPMLEKLRGRDGRSRAAEYRQVLANTPREVEVAQQAISKLPPSAVGRVLDTTTASRYALRQVRAEGRQERAAAASPADASAGIYHCRFQDLEAAASLAPGSVDLVVTDIPYGKDFLSQVSELGALASRVLKTGGVFVTHSGQFYLPQVLNALGEHLTYRWVISSTWPGNANMVHPFNLASQFKPILVFTEGAWSRTDRWSDVSKIDAREKDWHEWQQAVAESELLINYFSDPGDLVIDPCLGGGTTAVASRTLGRRFIGCDSDADCVARSLARLAGPE